MENARRTVIELKAKIKPFEERIAILKARINELQKRLDSDVIIDMRFFSEIQDDKIEIVSHKAEIAEMEREIKRWKRSIAILESNKY
jgi:peptidoglycan hydrolase CwlO-like protein